MNDWNTRTLIEDQPDMIVIRLEESTTINHHIDQDSLLVNAHFDTLVPWWTLGYSSTYFLVGQHRLIPIFHSTFRDIHRPGVTQAGPFGQSFQARASPVMRCCNSEFYSNVAQQQTIGVMVKHHWTSWVQGDGYWAVSCWCFSSVRSREPNSPWWSRSSLKFLDPFGGNQPLVSRGPPPQFTNPHLPGKLWDGVARSHAHQPAPKFTAVKHHESLLIIRNPAKNCVSNIANYMTSSWSIVRPTQRKWIAHERFIVVSASLRRWENPVRKEVVMGDPAVLLNLFVERITGLPTKS